MTHGQLVRLPVDLCDEAEAVGAEVGRTMIEQIDLWARLGREFEGSPVVSHREIVDLLSHDADT